MSSVFKGLESMYMKEWLQSFREVYLPVLEKRKGGGGEENWVVDSVCL